MDIKGKLKFCYKFKLKDGRKLKNGAPAATKSYILDADCERHRNLYCAYEAVLERKLPGLEPLRMHHTDSQFWHNRQRKWTLKK